MKPSIIVIDAPLSLPKGRCLEKDCECAVGGHLRPTEYEIRKYCPVLPLTFRGVKIASELKKGYDIFETHPRTNQELLGFEDPLIGLSSIFTVPFMQQSMK